MIKTLIENRQKATIAKIHKEFDESEDKLLFQAESLLKELNIPTETKIEEKANKLKSIGFINSEIVKQAESLQETASKIKTKLVETSSQAEFIKYHKKEYPFRKFLTEEELDRICNKYNLIYAPISHYIKDVPERNIQDIENRKKLNKIDTREVSYELIGVEQPQRMMEILGKTNLVFTESEVLSWGTKYYHYPDLLVNYLKEGSTSFTYSMFGDKLEYEQRRFESVKMIDKSGLFIAAPKSHFDLKDLKKEGKYGFMSVQIFEVKDPIVFEYCRFGCSVVTKWSTFDDFSAKDPLLTNEIEN